MSGWLKIHRKIKRWEWYDDIPCFRLFMHILIHCNYGPSKYKGHDVPPGGLVCGIPSLSQQTGLSPMQIRTAISKLTSTNEITVKKTNKFSIISITNWSIYQDEQQSNNEQITLNQHSSNTQITTSKERKNKEGKNNIIPPDVDQQIWDDFCSMRKRKKSPVTETALNRIRKEADKAGWTMNEALSEICARGWQGFKAEWVIEKGEKNGKSRTEQNLEGIMRWVES